MPRKSFANKLNTWLDLFTAGSQIGLKPNEVLDMSLDVFLAVLKGYHDRIFDQRCIAVEAGFWSGYYSRATRPKPLGKVLKGMLQNKDRAPREHAEDVDVEEFLRREQEFKEKLNG